jgi:ABC-2 type transport system ATP-binding protein
MILMGSNGAGKTTFINYLIGNYRTPKDHPFIENWRSEFKPLKSGSFGYSPEVSLLDFNSTAEDYIKLISEIRGIRVEPLEILESVKLSVPLNRQIRDYSKGMRQRLSLSLSFIGNHKTVVLDEPTSGLDIEGEKLITEILKSRADRYDYIISTHSPRLAIELGDEVSIFRGGEIIKRFSPESEKELWEIL